MKDETITYEKQDFYLVESLDDLIILRLGKNFLFEAIALAINKPLLDVFDNIAEIDEIKVLVITNCPEKTGSKDFLSFENQELMRLIATI